MSIERTARRLARERVMNTSRHVVGGDMNIEQVVTGVVGGLVYALLDIADAEHVANDMYDRSNRFDDQDEHEEREHALRWMMVRESAGDLLKRLSEGTDREVEIARQNLTRQLEQLDNSEGATQ